MRGALRRAAPALALYAAARLAGLAVAGAVALRTHRSLWTALGTSWDSNWYTGIAQHGYGTTLAGRHGFTYTDLAFFPLYPALQRSLATLVPVHMTVAGLVVAWLSALAAAWGIYAVGELLHGRRTGIALALLWGTLPHAVVETMAYSESLMTALSAWSLYALLTRRRLWAGVLALLAGLTRPNGVAVAVAVLCAAGLAVLRSRHDRRDWRVWVSMALAPLGWFGYLAWVGTRSGGPLGYFEIERDWGSRFDFGVSEIRFLKHVFTDRGTPPHLAYYMGAAAVLVALAALVLLALDRPPLPVLVYAIVLVVIAVGGSMFYACKPRFLLPAFPLLLPAAVALTRARPRAGAALLAGFAVVSAVYGAYTLFYAGTAP
ncbi:mannosyltransferase family protein [Streptomyces sp. NPDC058067]|uniref:mannosyltransferase family protein n=1 Tax=Streptomyces sp. NPDC058067 TaxID=3346324 RepID=UPI0036EA53D5